ncbi:dihydropteroate synthase [Methanotrichaceae archaeon M04Ac]|uniref:dihydropteroate synthase n=1 Tax=Candidatus Methanocrinis alkalitolerans TaxID=3033395 RepID=A0ABT5XBF6_9EURY|nr:dihydropteroate synthase [Candidatus Methanocrinis alkalitolerans]
MTIEGFIGKTILGDLHPVRVMGVINLSRESFYQESYAGEDALLERALSFAEEGSEVLDLGAVSTAPGSPPIPEEEERNRLFPALEAVLDRLGGEVVVSVDTQRAKVASDALSMGADCINDVSGLRDPDMARTVADHDGSLIIMASRDRPGDILEVGEIVANLGERLVAAKEAGVSMEKVTVDPGIGRWTPPKGPGHDLAILDGLSRLRVLNRPVMAALSRKSFIGAVLGRPIPAERLPGSLAATAIAVYNGAHLVRTHDVAASMDAIRMAEAVRGRPSIARAGGIEVEVFASWGRPQDLHQAFGRLGVEEGGAKALGGKGSFRALSIRGVTSMEAIVIKQEMLARGGDAAIPMGALRCDPGEMEVLVLGTAAQVRGLGKNLKSQPFNLPAVAGAIEGALERVDDPKRYW